MVHLQDDKHWRINPFDYRGLRFTLLFLLPFAAFLLLCFALKIHSATSDHVLIVLGQEQMVAGRPAAMRFTALSRQGDLETNIALTGFIARDGLRTVLFDGSAKMIGDSIPRNFEVPSMQPGPAEIEIIALIGAERLEVGLPVQILEAPPAGARPIASLAFKPEDGYRVVKDDAEIEVFTEDNAAPIGLQSAVFLRAADEFGEPREIDLEVALDKGFEDAPASRACTTDRFGLALLPLTPAAFRPPIDALGAKYVAMGREPLETAESEGVDSAQLFAEVAHGGISAAVANPILPLGDEVRIALLRLSKKGALHIDVFNEGRLVQAESVTADGFEPFVTIKPAMPGLNRIRISENSLPPAGSVAMRNVFVTGKFDDSRKGFEDVLQKLEEAGQELQWARAAREVLAGGTAEGEVQLASAFALSRLETGHLEPEVLLQSLKKEKAELAAAKTGFHRAALIVLGVLAVVLLVQLVGLLLNVRSGRRSYQKSLVEVKVK